MTFMLIIWSCDFLPEKSPWTFFRHEGVRPVSVETGSIEISLGQVIPVNKSKQYLTFVTNVKCYCYMLQLLHFVTSVVFHIGFNCPSLLHVLHIHMLIVTFHYICCILYNYKFVSTVTFFCIRCICSNCYILLEFMFYYILLQFTFCNIYYNFKAKTIKMVKYSQSCVKHQKF